MGLITRAVGITRAGSDTRSAQVGYTGTRYCRPAGSVVRIWRRGRLHAVHPPALRCLAISVSRSQAGDDAPADVATSWATVGSWIAPGLPSNLPWRLASHRWVRSASPESRGSSGDQSNAASHAYPPACRRRDDLGLKSRG